MKALLTSIITLLLVTGCSTSYRITVSGFAEPGAELPEGAEVQVLTDPNVPNPIFYSQARAKIEELIADTGRHPTDSDARYKLTFLFGSSDRVVQDYYYDYIPYGYYGDYFHMHDFGGYWYYRPYAETIWDYWLILRLHDTRAPDPGHSVIWVGEAGTSKSYADKRQALDYLLVALFQYFGQDTGRNIKVTLTEDDPRIQLLSPRSEAFSPERSRTGQTPASR